MVARARRDPGGEGVVSARPPCGGTSTGENPMNFDGSGMTGPLTGLDHQRPTYAIEGLFPPCQLPMATWAVRSWPGWNAVSGWIPEQRYQQTPLGTGRSPSSSPTSGRSGGG